VTNIGEHSEELLLSSPEVDRSKAAGRCGWPLVICREQVGRCRCRHHRLLLGVLLLGPFVYHSNQIQTNLIAAYQSPGKGHRSAPTPTGSTSSAGL